MLNLNKPEKGFYYHYKHDPDGTVNNYAYEVMGVAAHTEIDDEFMVVYRPLYKSFVYNNGLDYDVRPLDMFMEAVEKDTYQGARFTRITDEGVIAELTAIRAEMYGK